MSLRKVETQFEYTYNLCCSRAQLRQPKYTQCLIQFCGPKKTCPQQTVVIQSQRMQSLAISNDLVIFFSMQKNNNRRCDIITGIHSGGKPSRVEASVGVAAAINPSSKLGLFLEETTPLTESSHAIHVIDNLGRRQAYLTYMGPL